MSAGNSSSIFTKGTSEAEPFGPPLIGALLRMPWEAVQRHMLERLHERGFDDFDVAHLNVFQYPGPQGARPSDLAARLRISKQALNYLLGELERLDPDQGRLVELRFFSGMTIEETAEVLGLSPATVKREWAVAKGWLHRALTRGTA